MNKNNNLYLYWVGLAFLFTIIYIWVGNLYLSFSYDRVTKESSLLIAQSIKNSYETKLSAFYVIEEKFNFEIKSKLFLIKDKIKTKEDISHYNLEKLKSEYNLGDIYIINDDGVVIKSTNSKKLGININDFYKENLEWKKEFKLLVDSKDKYKVESFSQSKFPPYYYKKIGYISGEKIEEIGKIIIEINLTIEDIFQNNLYFDDLQYAQKNRIVEIKNLKDYKSNLTFKQDIVEDNIETIIKINNQDEKPYYLNIITTFSEINEERRLQMLVSILSTIFIVFSYSAFVYIVNFNVSFFEEKKIKLNLILNKRELAKRQR